MGDKDQATSCQCQCKSGKYLIMFFLFVIVILLSGIFYTMQGAIASCGMKSGMCPISKTSGGFPMCPIQKSMSVQEK